jgi:hypothetical protein
VISVAILASGTAWGSLVSDWQDALVAADARGTRGAIAFTRGAAILHLAMFDSGNAIARRYSSYRTPPPFRAPASAHAAAAVAAHTVLTRLYPESAAQFDERLRIDLEAVAEGSARENGVELGRVVAERLLAERESDGWLAPSVYRAEAEARPGRYRPTKPPVGSHFAAARPFALARADELRPPPPPSLDSPEWTAARDEVRARGGKTSATRTAEEAEVARFIAVSHTKFQLQPVSMALRRRGLPWLEESRLMALASVASADATVASFEAKYHYLFWRPETALADGWAPLVDTPPHPEYPCNHCVQAAAAAAFLEAAFPVAPPRLVYVNPSMSPATRELGEPAAMVQASIAGRVNGGIHYRFSGEAGARLGRAVAERVMRELLR